jgi:hypothetical protein
MARLAASVIAASLLLIGLARVETSSQAREPAPQGLMLKGLTDTSRFAPGAVDPFIGPSTIMLGGIAAGYGGNLMIRGQPYGNYDNGTLVSLVNCGYVFTSCRAGVASALENGPALMATYGFLDSVNLYNQANSYPVPLIVSTGVAYDPTHIYFNPKLTAAQMADIHPYEYVLTNSIDRTVSTKPSIPGALPPLALYASMVRSVASDGSFVSVTGWTVPGSGHTAAGQTPSTDYDTMLGFSTPMVAFGAMTNIFTNNTVLQAPRKNTNSYVNSYQYDEVDMQDFSVPPYNNAWRGLTLSYAPYGGNKPTAESYFEFMSGPMPTALRIRQSGTRHPPGRMTAIDTDTFLNYIGASPAAALGSENLSAEWLNLMDTNDARLQLSTVRDSRARGWPSMSLHLGMQIDGTVGALDGTQMGQVVWNAQGYRGGVCLQSSTGQNVACAANSQLYIPKPSTVPPVASSCGSGCTVVSGSGNNVGIITVGSGGVNSGTLTFAGANPFASSGLATAACVLTVNGQNAYAYIVSENAQVMKWEASATLLSGASITYHCF